VKITVLLRALVIVVLCWLPGAEAAPVSAAAQAAQVGLPTIDSSGAVAGPFSGPEGTLYYLGRGDLLTFFHPTQYVAYFAESNGGALRFRYALTPQGQFVVDGANRAQQVQVLPDDVYRWPHAEAVAQVLIQYLLAIRQGQLAAPTGGVDWGAMSAASAALHQSNMAILGNMGSSGCTEYYDGVYYLGCW